MNILLSGKNFIFVDQIIGSTPPVPLLILWQGNSMKFFRVCPVINIVNKVIEPRHPIIAIINTINGLDTMDNFYKKSINIPSFYKETL